MMFLKTNTQSPQYNSHSVRLSRFSTLMSTAILAWMLYGSIGTAIAANPSVENPTGYIDFHGITAEGKAIGEEAIKSLESLEKFAAELSKKIEPKKIGPAVANSRRAAALILRLKSIGEPSSWDLALRAKRPTELISIARTKFFTTQESRQYSDKAQAELTKSDKKLYALAAKAQELAEKNEWDKAEQDIDKVLMPLWEKVAYLQASAPNGGRAVEDAANAIMEHQVKARAGRFASEADKLIEQNEERRAVYLKMLGEAAQQVAQNGQVQYDGKSLNGAQAVNQFILDFGPIHVGMLQNGFLECLKTAAESARQSSGSSSDSEHPGLVAWNQRIAESCNLLQKGVTAIVEADAGRLNGSSATQAYIAYVQALGPHLNRFDTKPWLDAAKEPLGILVAKSDAKSAIENYREATDDLLRWKRKVIEAKISKLTSADYPHLHKTFRDAASGKDGVPGMYNNGDSPRFPPRCSLPIPDNLQNTWKTIQDKAISTERIVRFDGEKPLYMSRIYLATFVRPKEEMPLEQELSVLQSELNVDGTHPALALEAEFALATAKRGELDKMGGKVIGMGFESLSNRFIKLPPIAGQFVRYSGGHPSLYPNDEMGAIAVRLDVKPDWWATHYIMKKAQ